MPELPDITASSYTSTPINMMAMAANNGGLGLAQERHAQQRDWQKQTALADLLYRQQNAQPIPKEEKKAMASQTRLVQVFIADPNDNLPLDRRLLYSGEQKLTDLTDQELFFEVDIKSILDKHNAVRTSTVNKSVKERTEHLEPARIRDLKMTVVTIAQF